MVGAGLNGVEGVRDQILHAQKLPATYLLFSSTSAPVGDVLPPAGGRPNFKRLNKPYRLPALRQPEITKGVGGVKEARAENGRTKKKERWRGGQSMGEGENWQKGNEGDGNLVEKRKSDRGAKDGFRMRGQMEKMEGSGQGMKKGKEGGRSAKKRGNKNPPTSSGGRGGCSHLEAMTGRGED